MKNLPTPLKILTPIKMSSLLKMLFVTSEKSWALFTMKYPLPCDNVASPETLVATGKVLMVHLTGNSLHPH